MNTKLNLTEFLEQAEKSELNRKVNLQKQKNIMKAHELLNNEPYFLKDFKRLQYKYAYDVVCLMLANVDVFSPFFSFKTMRLYNERYKVKVYQEPEYFNEIVINECLQTHLIRCCGIDKFFSNFF